MPSPPPNNILLDPVPELEQALHTNAFGINPSSTHIVLSASFPLTAEEKAAVATTSRKTGMTGETVVARAMVGLVEGGVVEVVLDRRGYTVSGGVALPNPL